MADEESLEMRDKAGLVGKSTNSLSIDLSTRRRHQSSGSVGKWLVPATNACKSSRFLGVCLSLANYNSQVLRMSI